MFDIHRVPVSIIQKSKLRLKSTNKSTFKKTILDTFGLWCVHSAQQVI